MKGLFVTGTDTGVGKTYVACRIAEALRQAGQRFAVMKPISTGDREDAARLIEASGTVEKLDTVNPVFLDYPLAPLIASDLEGKPVDMSGIWKIFADLKKKYGWVLVEGVGGLMVPLRDSYFVIDMIERSSLPVLIVARGSLGTINHTLLTVSKLKDRRIPISGIVMNSQGPFTIVEKTNAATIRNLTGLPVLELGNGAKIDLKENPWITGKKQDSSR